LPPKANKFRTVLVMMKNYRSTFLALLQGAALAGAMLAAAPLSRAQDVVVDHFDTADEVLGWARWWGAASQTYEFDPSVDAKNDPNSGSLKATIGFDLALNDNQFAVVAGFPGGEVLDGTQYTNLVFDLKWDPSSPKRPSGDFGSFEFGLRASDFSQIWLGPTSPITIQAVTTNNGWLHVVAPIDPTVKGIDKITGVVLKMWSGDPKSGQTGTAIFWVDNVALIANTNQVAAAPALSLVKAQPGLQIFASKANAQYQRQSIRTVNPEYSWVGSSQPVTYSLTITNYPDTNHAGFQTQLFLVPGDTVPTFETSPDWNEPNIVFLDIENNANGGGSATFRYKTNLPNGNTMIYNSSATNGPVGTLASITAPQMVGTWSLTFSNDTSVTLTGPGGVSTNFDFPSEAAPLFADPLYAYIGVQPNQPGNINQSALFSNVQITGVQDPINESFTGVALTNQTQTTIDLDPAIWERVAEDPAGVALVPPDSSYWIKWSVPAAGYTLQVTPALGAPSWTDVTAPATQIGSEIRTVVGASTLPGGNAAFFRLVKPPQ
jgi:hypothetical protein